jgi:FAD/FMN-containing dehydrogenase/Fe-S oxidoreductase
MIPKLPIDDRFSPAIRYFVSALKRKSFHGDISVDLADRVSLSSDNSVYHNCPQVVVFPKYEQDIVVMMRLASADRFSSIVFSPRGGGTGTNGQSLTNGILVDCSRYMRKILEIDELGHWVRVQPGVILDQLNETLKPRGVFLPLSISTSNRATLGGMFNTDACGKGSMVYGKTSDHVLASRHVMTDGSLLICDKKHQDQKTSELEQNLYDLIRPYAKVINNKFPKLQRFLTGYNLKNALDKADNTSQDKVNKVDLNSLLSGSEGTLTFCTQLTLNLIPIPENKCLLVLGYSSFRDALSDSLRLRSLKPIAIETVDWNILELAKKDEVYHDVKDYFSFDDKLRGLNLIEFNCSLSSLAKKADGNFLKEGKILQHYKTDNKSEIKALWAIRKKGVGLLAAMQGPAQPIAFVEDTVVSPDKLPEYIDEFREILDGYGLKYGMFGHADVGCIHVRPALNMMDKTHQKWFVEISQKVNELVIKYDGLFWAEHGKGYKSVFLPEYLGKGLYTLMRKVKSVFDPHNKLNPGKIASPLDLDSDIEDLGLKKIGQDFRGDIDRSIPDNVRGIYAESFLCNGNAQCMSFETNVVMCPSYKATYDRIHSPKGRSMLLREWLLLATSKVRKEKAAKKEAEALLQKSIEDNKGKKTNTAPGVVMPASTQKDDWTDRSYRYLRFFTPRSWALFKYVQKKDFSHQVYRSMQGCLGCKACATSCPVKVNIPYMRSKFLYEYHKRFGRSWQDLLIARFEVMSNFRKKWPLLTKIALDNKMTDWFLERIVGLSDLPRVKKGYCREAIPFDKKAKELVKKMAQTGKAVCLLTDSFNALYESSVIENTAKVIEALGYQVYLLPVLASGKMMHHMGMLDEFKEKARNNILIFNELAKINIPIVGIEPSVTLFYEEEYKKAFFKACKYEVKLVQSWMSEVVDKKIKANEKWLKALSHNQPESYKILSHCIERAGVPNANKQWQKVFNYFGVKLDHEPIGCCGMAGLYGHLSENKSKSIGIYKGNWEKVIKHTGIANIVASGFSCRCQIERMERQEVLHPLDLLARIIS